MSFKITRGTGPIVAAAIHAGHRLRLQVEQETALDEETRFREEDPYTDRFTVVASSRIVVDTSRFEVDLNRPREKAVYLTEEDAWGLDVWKRPLPPSVLQESLGVYDQFYAELGCLLDDIRDEYGSFLVLDVHSYNHRRGGAQAPPDDPLENPEVNVGTSNIEKGKWSSLMDRFMNDFRMFDFAGRSLDVRENVKFTGGNFARWINRRYRDSGCAIAIEFKKIFMDEWSGDLDGLQLELLVSALESTVPGLLEELGK